MLFLICSFVTLLFLIENPLGFIENIDKIYIFIITKRLRFINKDFIIDHKQMLMIRLMGGYGDAV